MAPARLAMHGLASLGLAPFAPYHWLLYSESLYFDVTKARTELIIFIRPTVIRDPVDARMVAEELRSKLNGELVGGNFPGIHNGPVIRP